MEKGRVAKIAFRTVGVAVGSLALLGGVGWLGLQVKPAPFPPHPERTQGDNLAMWAEAPFTTPSALVLDPRVRWEPIDDTSARLVVPFGEHEEPLRVEFDPGTGLITRISGTRYRGQEETMAPWHGEFSEWKTVRGIKVPHRPVGVWEDWEGPCVVLDLEGAEYNVAVSEKIPDAEDEPGRRSSSAPT